MRELMPCGTRAAYIRHNRRGEEVDDACRVANNEHAKDLRIAYSRAKQRAAQKLAADHASEFSALLTAAREAEPVGENPPRTWRSRTRQRALRTLYRNHPAQFAALLATERAAIEAQEAAHG